METKSEKQNKVEYVKLNLGYKQHFWSSGNGFTIAINEVKKFPKGNAMVEYALEQGVLSVASKEDYEAHINVEEKQQKVNDEKYIKREAKRKIEEEKSNEKKKEKDKKVEKLIKDKPEEEILKEEESIVESQPILADPK